jgi:hypothetical protein
MGKCARPPLFYASDMGNMNDGGPSVSSPPTTNEESPAQDATRSRLRAALNLPRLTAQARHLRLVPR